MGKVQNLIICIVSKKKINIAICAESVNVGHGRCNDVLMVLVVLSGKREDDPVLHRSQSPKSSFL